MVQFGEFSVLEGLSTVVSYGPSFSLYGTAILFHSTAPEVEALVGGFAIANRYGSPIVFVTTVYVARLRVLVPILDRIYRAILGGDMCAVRGREEITSGKLGCRGALQTVVIVVFLARQIEGCGGG